MLFLRVASLPVPTPSPLFPHPQPSIKALTPAWRRWEWPLDRRPPTNSPQLPASKIKHTFLSANLAYLLLLSRKQPDPKYSFSNMLIHHCFNNNNWYWFRFTLLLTISGFMHSDISFMLGETFLVTSTSSIAYIH